MEFDKRIKDISKIMNCFTVKEAKKYLHTYGYFVDNIEDFYNLEYLNINELTGIDEDSKYPYRNLDKQGYIFKLFLPCTFVADEEEPKEKKYRPYTLAEFQSIFTVGVPIRLRRKNKKLEKFLILIGYDYLENGDAVIEIGNYVYTLKELFEYYEWQKAYTDEFKPFGVEDES